MADSTNRTTLAQFYRGVHQSFTAFVSARLDATDTPVPATPGWTVHDSVAHVTGVAEDLASGWRPTGGPTAEWTAGHVARGNGIPTGELLVKWAGFLPAIEELLEQAPVWPLVLDVASHELDVRAALGDTGARDTELVSVGGHQLLKWLEVPSPLIVETDERTVRVGPESSGQLTTLKTSAFEAFRWRLGRRSPRQLAAMDWSDDPTPFLDCLCVFGPAEVDVFE